MAKVRDKSPQIILLDSQEVTALLAEVKPVLSEATYQLVEAVFETLQWLSEQLEKKRVSLARLKRLLFGSKSEKTQKVLAGDTQPDGTKGGADDAAPPKRPGGSGSKGNPKGKGHGRRAASDYSGAEVVQVPHPELRVGSICPKCAKAILYALKTPARIVCVKAQPMFAATLFELERLRCALCGALFTAPPPAEAAGGKYAPNVGPSLAINRFGMGVPMYRTDQWQHDLGVPLPAGTQWDLINQSAKTPEHVYGSLIIHAAQGWLFHNDDTHIRVQSLRQPSSQPPQSGSKERTGIFTTSVISRVGPHHIALFFTGHQHAGENLQHVLNHRAADLDIPLQMSDGLACNTPKESQTTCCHCIPHARRKFVEVSSNFPESCQKVLEGLCEIYRVDARAKNENLSASQRLALHQQHSKPVMEELHTWMQEQIDQKIVEPNSGLGNAIKYMLKHWDPLTRFLTVPGAPLDNNICELALKMAILHRKNSMGYKTLRGAHVADVFMSLIHTCRLNSANPYDYLLSLEKHGTLVAQDPTRWFPWNYSQTPREINTS